MEYRAHLSVIQHTSASYLGLMEDHPEGRQIRFTYHRPFTERGGIPRAQDVADGLVLLGGGPWGSAGPRNVPTLVREVELAHACLARGLPVLGIELGAQILALAAGGRSHAAPLELAVHSCQRTNKQGLAGYLPQQFSLVSYMRDDFDAPPGAEILATTEDQRVALFRCNNNALGFRGHPGFKPAIAEDLVMEFEESPEDVASGLVAARALGRTVADDLVAIMTGVVSTTGWMG